MEYEKRKVTVDQALYTASDIVHECVAASDIEWYMKNIRDHDAGLFMHSMRVAFLTAAHCCFTKRTPKETKAAATGALIHDVGKILIPKDILEKPGQLTTEEYKIVKKHPEMGDAYLVTHQSTSKKISDMARKIVLQHHENWDGSGYPHGLREKEIDELASAVHICDVYDALVSKRTYKEAFPREKAVHIMLEDCGSKFSPIQLEYFLTWLSATNEETLESRIRFW